MRMKAGWIIFALAFMALGLDLLASQWLHVRVRTESEVSVSVNLPVEAVESLMPDIDVKERRSRKVTFHKRSFSYEELYDIWQELRAQPSRTIERRRLAFSRQGSHYIVRKPSRWGSENVEIRTPAPVVDALFSGRGRFDVKAAARALADEASGEVFEILVDEGEKRVEIWVDDSN